MPRILGPDALCEMALRDRITQDRYILYYRVPTSEERIQYHQQILVKQRNKVISKFPETALKFGLKLITGFKKGNFAKLVGGKQVLFSSDPADPDYDPNWKELIKQYASDLVTCLAANVFDGTAPDTDEQAPDEAESGSEEGAGSAEDDAGPKD